MKAIRFTYIYPLPDPDDIAFDSDQEAIEFARDSIEELIAQEGFQCLGEVITLDPDSREPIA